MERPRPVTFSESDLDLTRLEAQLVVPLTGSIQLLPRSPKDFVGLPWSWTAHRWAIRFSLHLALISLFETLFFWHFVSVQEDTALIGLINSYTSGIWSTCRNLTPIQRTDVAAFVDLFLNQTAIDADGTTTALQRASYNDVLLRNSWAYLGGICGVFTALAAAAVYRGMPLRWGYIVGENLTLVTLLGLYEWMYFSTVVLKYRSISIPELDQRVFDEFQRVC